VYGPVHLPVEQLLVVLTYLFAQGDSFSTVADALGVSTGTGE